MRFQILAFASLLSLAVAQSDLPNETITSAPSVPTVPTAVTTAAPDIGAFSRNAQQDESALSILSAQLATETNLGQQTQLSLQIQALSIQLAVLSSQAGFDNAVSTAAAANASANALAYISSLSAIMATETNSAIRSQLSVQISQISTQAHLPSTTSSESAKATGNVVTTTDSEGKTITSTASAASKAAASGSSSASSSSSSAGAMATRVPALGAALMGAAVYLL
ncbi:hypothetical protein NHQ30_002897 [Ciborinia camelliae]|nr:hypothetical protein NHQ30_002897 [Ciborinia camelliae]